MIEVRDLVIIAWNILPEGCIGALLQSLLLHLHGSKFSMTTMKWMRKASVFTALHLLHLCMLHLCMRSASAPSMHTRLCLHLVSTHNMKDILLEIPVYIDGLSYKSIDHFNKGIAIHMSLITGISKLVEQLYRRLIPANPTHSINNLSWLNTVFSIPRSAILLLHIFYAHYGTFKKTSQNWLKLVSIHLWI